MLESEILLIGIGPNKYKINEIYETNNIKDIEKFFGTESSFYEACRIMKTFNKEKFFIMNIESWEDIQNVSDQFVNYNFDYICPLDLYIDDRYYDDLLKRNLLHCQKLLFLLSNTMSTIVMTGKHASLYEDLDSYLEDEKRLVNLGYAAFDSLHRENIIYVANNLNNYKKANVVLATLLAITDYSEYPNSSLLGPAIFDIYYSDVSDKLVYFKNNFITGTTIENLVNFADNKIVRLVPVYKIIKYFYFNSPKEQEQFVGQTFSEYKKIKIEESLDNFLKNLVGKIIYKYQIQNVIAVNSANNTVDIVLKYDIWPKFTTERYRMETRM